MIAMRSDSAIDTCRAQLHAAGWSVGEACFGRRWSVTGSNGENALCAEGVSQAEAWRLACAQAVAVGMLGWA